MRMLMNRSDMNNAVCATIMAAALVSVAGGAERAAVPRGERDVEYIVVELEVPAPWQYVKPYAMNDQGQIVGQGEYAGDDRAFLWDDGEMINLGFDVAYDINNSGIIVGYSWVGDDHHAVAWVDGEIIELGDGAEGTAYAINNQGMITGSCEIEAERHAVIGDVTGWKLDLQPDLPGFSGSATGINEEGIVVGTVTIGPGEEGFCGAVDAFMWDDGEVTLLWQVPPNHEVCYGTWDINHARCVVGEKHSGYFMYCMEYEREAWQWYAGEGVLLPNPNSGPGESIARAINDAGDAVGWASDWNAEYGCGALWRNGVPYDLNDLIDPECEFHVWIAYDIDDRGRILAGGSLADPYALLLLLPIKPGDIDGDGDVDTADLLALLAAWGPCEGCPEDIDGNGVVNTADLLTLLANWG